MKWNYCDIDEDPPRGLLLILTEFGDTIKGLRNEPSMVAWLPIPEADPTKSRCQNILRGLPELRMVSKICEHPKLLKELEIALAHYHEDQLSDFTQLVRLLDKQAQEL